MTQMIRKQIYIRKRQEQLLKRQAKLRGVSEAELIRQAIDNQLNAGTLLTKPDRAAWEESLAFMKSLHAQGPLSNRRRSWTREDLYDDSVN